MNNLKEWLLDIKQGEREDHIHSDLLLAVEIIDHIYDIADLQLKNLIIEYIDSYRKNNVIEK